MPRPLSESQLTAIGSRHPHTFVEAGPGSGKTTVAAERYGLLHFHRRGPGAPPVVALSFTQSATAELRGRIRRSWGRSFLDGHRSVRTVDSEFTLLLEYLLRSETVRWPNAPTELDPRDSWVGHPSYKFRLPQYRKGYFFAIGLAGSAVSPIRLRDRSASHTFTKAAVKQVLLDGECAHDDVRRIVMMAMDDPELRKVLTAHIAATRSHVIIDEVFDSNETDLALVELYCDAGIGITAIGDYWQSLYDFRDAEPELAEKRLMQLGFERIELEETFRFDTDEAALLALRARTGPAPLPAAGAEVEVVLAARWVSLWAAPAWVLPIGIGQVDNKTDALLTLLVDHLTQQRLGMSVRAAADAFRLLKFDESHVQDCTHLLNGVCELLTDDSVPTAEAALAVLRSAPRQLGAGPTAKVLGQKREASAVGVVQHIARRVTHGGILIPGLSVHQAKGQEWRRVGVVLDEEQRSRLSSGLDRELAQDRVTYVALTRGRDGTFVVE